MLLTLIFGIHNFHLNIYIGVSKCESIIFTLIFMWVCLNTLNSGLRPDKSCSWIKIPDLNSSQCFQANQNGGEGEMLMYSLNDPIVGRILFYFWVFPFFSSIHLPLNLSRPSGKGYFSLFHTYLMKEHCPCTANQVTVKNYPLTSWRYFWIFLIEINFKISTIQS